jgi:hypothetical protein
MSAATPVQCFPQSPRPAIHPVTPTSQTHPKHASCVMRQSVGFSFFTHVISLLNYNSACFECRIQIWNASRPLPPPCNACNIWSTCNTYNTRHQYPFLGHFSLCETAPSSKSKKNRQAVAASRPAWSSAPPSLPPFAAASPAQRGQRDWLPAPLEGWSAQNRNQAERPRRICAYRVLHEQRDSQVSSVNDTNKPQHAHRRSTTQTHVIPRKSKPSYACLQPK